MNFAIFFVLLTLFAIGVILYFVDKGFFILFVVLVVFITNFVDLNE